MKLHNAQDLDRAIIELERRKVIQETILVQQFHTTVDHFKPKNLLKSAFNKVLEPSDTRTTIMKAAGGLGIGMLAKKMFFGKSHSLIGKLATNALKITATNSVINHADTIAAWGTAIYHNLFKKKPDTGSQNGKHLN